MSHSTLLRFSTVLAAAALAIAGCNGAPLPGEDEIDNQSQNAVTSGHPSPPGQPHLMHRKSLQSSSAPAGAHLTYYGGPVISNVKVYTVFWNSAVNYQSNLNSFYGAVTNSAYMDWLTEYNTNTQTIGRGTLAGSIVDSSPPAGSTIDDTQIQAEVVRLINTGAVPFDANSLYMFHFPPGITITQGGNASCSYFCAYHGTTTRNGSDVYYGVIPDMGGGCASGCGTSTQFNNTTMVSSHELVEAITDAAVGLATTYAPPLAWYDQTNGEIGDICNQQAGTIAGYTVQKEFSNQANNCIISKTVTNDFSISANPTSLTVKAGATGTVTISTAVTSGSAQTVALSVSGLPSGVSGAFNPTSVTAGGSSTLTVTAAANAPTSSSTLTITGTGTSATHGTNVSLSVSGSGGGGTQLIVNGGFEAGNLSSWTTSGSDTATTSPSHSGSWAARVGSTSPLNGNSTLKQKITVPATGTTTLSFWYSPRTSDTITYDWQDAYITDANGVILKTLLHVCANNTGWTQVTASLNTWAGKAVYVEFLTHDDNYPGDPTYMYVDDVSVLNQ